MGIMVRLKNIFSAKLEKGVEELEDPQECRRFWHSQKEAGTAAGYHQ